MNIGKLDSKIRIYKQTIGINELGEQQPEGTLLKTIWSAVLPRTGSMMNGRAADVMLSKTTHCITIRAEEAMDITVDCLIRWNDLNGKEHVFDIDYVLPPTRKSRFTEVYVQEVV